MGRNVAGATFLDALLEHGQLEALQLFIDSGASERAAIELKSNLSNKIPIEIVSGLNINSLNNSGGLFFPGPNIAQMSYRRSFIGHTSWSISGITHTTSSSTAMDAIGSLVTAPVQPWDALICTSPAVKSHVESILEAQKHYLSHRLAIQKFPTLNLPVIPLGIDTKRFSSLGSKRKQSRMKMRLSDDEIVISFVGRLSWHAKANPLPMYLALLEICELTDKKITLVECGWFANEASREVFQKTQKMFENKIKFMHVDGRMQELVDGVYSASDIFISLSDNIQETFGITPIEAMCSGLPVIVSDWNGYRHSVRDGIDGFRIQTRVPQSTHHQDLIYRYEMNIDTYDYYCGLTSMSNVVDVSQLSKKLKILIDNPDIRAKMGEAGRQRAKEVYDWSVIIKQYRNLWENLDNIRKDNSDEVLTSPTIWPERLDPIIGFKQYPTETIKLTEFLKLGSVSGELLEAVLNDHMVSYAKHVVISADTTRTALAQLPEKFTVEEIANLLAPGNLTIGMRYLASLMKFDVVRLCEGDL